MWLLHIMHVEIMMSHLIVMCFIMWPVYIRPCWVTRLILCQTLNCLSTCLYWDSRRQRKVSSPSHDWSHVHHMTSCMSHMTVFTLSGSQKFTPEITYQYPPVSNTISFLLLTHPLTLFNIPVWGSSKGWCYSSHPSVLLPWSWFS